MVRKRRLPKHLLIYWPHKRENAAMMPRFYLPAAALMEADGCLWRSSTLSVLHFSWKPVQRSHAYVHVVKVCSPPPAAPGRAAEDLACLIRAMRLVCTYYFQFCGQRRRRGAAFVTLPGLRPHQRVRQWGGSALRSRPRVLLACGFARGCKFCSQRPWNKRQNGGRMTHLSFCAQLSAVMIH